MSAYGEHLQNTYARRSISSGGKWPAKHMVNNFIGLAVVSHTSRSRDDIINHILPGSIDELLEHKESIEVEDILKPGADGKRVSLVLIEGAPGIGKSTLAWELCRRWKNTPHFEQFSLVVLHRFRDKSTRQINEVSQLFPYYWPLQELVTFEVNYLRNGEGVLFILDGFDEFPDNNNRDNLLIKLIVGDILPEATVIVTSRPSAAVEFFSHEPIVTKHLEILGFTQDKVREYASEAFSENTTVLDGFLKYIEASRNPTINTLMYIPLNAAIVVDVYKSSTQNDQRMPKTLTQLYTQLCLTVFRRYLHEKDSRDIILNDISDLSKYGHRYNTSFEMLSHLAFEKFRDNEVIFYSLPDDLVHFGLLNSDPSLFGGGSISYNFLHFTVQEFLAAYYISNPSSHDHEMQVFHKYGHDRRWNLVWRFVAGLTKLEYFVNETHNEVFVDLQDSTVQVRMFFFLCLFEADLRDQFDFSSTYKEANTFQFSSSGTRLSPMDLYFFGYCIVNSAPTVAWKIAITCMSVEMFSWGLNSATTPGNVLYWLQLVGTDETYLDNFPLRILEGIVVLDLQESEIPQQALSFMSNLRSFSYLPERPPRPPKVISLFHQLHNKVTNLTIEGEVLKSHHVCMSLGTLVRRTVKHLRLMKLPGSNYGCTSKEFFEILFNSSLETLFVSIINCESEYLFTSLSINNHLTNITFDMLNCIPPLGSLAIALQHNTALQYLELLVSNNMSVENCDNIKLITYALKYNNGHLKKLDIYVWCSYIDCYKDILIYKTDLDFRITVNLFTSSYIPTIWRRMYLNEFMHNWKTFSGASLL
jgi:hypothetical protein